MKFKMINKSIALISLGIFIFSIISPAYGQPAPSEVRKAQQMLKDKGFDPGDIDGVLGPKTQEALRKFQAEKGLEITGSPDIDTQKALGAIEQIQTDIDNKPDKISVTEIKKIPETTPDTKVRETVIPAKALQKRQQETLFHLKTPEEAEKMVPPETKPTPSIPVAIGEPIPESKRYHLVHRPIKKGESCVSAKCHSDKIKGPKYVHAPVATGFCMLCHEDIAANPPFGLTRTGQDLCLACHKDMKAGLSQARVIHKPVKDNCTGCHNPHGADSKVFLRESTVSLCVKCHKKTSPELMARIKNYKVPHKPVVEGKCAECHAPHVSNFDKLLKAGPKELDLCFSCHKKEAEKINKAPYKHGPIREGLCTTCHQTHGSDFIKILKYYFVEKFYNPFDPKVYALCFKCHKETVVLEERTTALTNFRNGDRNLHYLHVNRKKGRTCLACHEVHAGFQERKIRRSTPFGNWKIPVQFVKTATGGKCLATCHIPKSYDRVKPFKLTIDEVISAGAQQSSVR